MPPLIRAMQHPHPIVQGRAAKALAAIGPAAKIAVPYLVRALKSEYMTVRGQAAIALKKIDPDAAARAGVN